MKKYLTAAALFAAGTAFANAVSITTDAPSSTVNARTSQSNGLYGFEFTLSTASVSGQTGTLSGNYFLESLSVWESNNASSQLGTTATLAVYEIKAEGEISFVAASSGTSTASSRIYDSAGGYYSRTAEQYSFENATVSANATYLAAFFLTSGFDLSAVSGYTTLATAVSSSTAASLSLTDVSGASLGGGVFTSSSSSSPSASYAPILQATLATIPEPSAFGLLAGAGALALVAARRRRSKR